MSSNLRDSVAHFDSPSRTTGLVVKTCGIMRLGHAMAAVELGADMLGLVFAPSRRTVSREFGRAVRMALDRLERKPLVVGVFVNESPGSVLATADAVGLDIVQLSGDETPGQTAECARRYPVLKALRFSDNTSAAIALHEFQKYRDLVPPDRLRFVVDAFRVGEYGGTGQVSNWELAARLAEQDPVMLAGGLNPQNVGDAVGTVSPWGVDVSSGIEQSGVKDRSLMQSFIAEARRAELVQE